MTIRKFFALGLFVAAFFVLTPSMEAQKFGYINSGEILNALPEVKQADANLEAYQKQLQKNGQKMVEQFQKDYEAIQQKVQAGTLSPKQQEEEGAKLQQRQLEIQQYEQDMVQKLEAKRNTLLKPIYDKVDVAIKAVAKEGGYQFIFEQGVLLYADESQDVSAKVKAKLGM